MAAHSRSVYLTTDQRLDLILSTADIGVGEGNYSLPCPVCGEKGSFSVTKVSGGLLYNCFRVTCGIRGLVRTSTAPWDGASSKKPFKPCKYMFDSTSMSHSWQKHFAGKYGIAFDTMEKNDWTISTETSRLLAPLYDFDGRRFGLNAKMLPGSEYPGSKSIKYLEEESLGIAFPRTNPSHDGTIVVVEDSISAVKLSQFINAVALLGTSMNEDQALFLASKYSHVIIALDPDAAMKAVWMLEKYKGVFEKISVVFLEKDPKDSAVIVLETKLGEVTDEPIGAGKCDC